MDTRYEGNGGTRNTTLHDSTFDYLAPSDEQKAVMEKTRAAVKECARNIERHVPDGPDKTYALRHLREVGFWANVAITREADGSPRTGDAFASSRH